MAIMITAALDQIIKQSDGIPFPDDRGDGFGGFEGPDYAIEPWDLLVLNGTKVPGISTVKVVPKKVIEVTKAAGVNGGPTYDRGHQAARIDISILVWTPSQWGLLQRLLRRVWHSPGIDPRVEDAEGRFVEVRAVTIEHPACQAPWNISAVMIESLESAQKVSEGLRINIKAVQYISPRQFGKTGVPATAPARANMTPELRGARNGIPEAPSKTEASPRLRLPVERGPR